MRASIQATTDGLKNAHTKGLAVVIMEPLKGGQLANPPKEALSLMQASGIERKPVDWALQYLWNRPEVSVVLSRMELLQMVDENCARADRSGIDSLCEEEERTITQIADIYRCKILVPCTACGYYMPCLAGVNIPKNFAFLNNKSMGSSGMMGWIV